MRPTILLLLLLPVFGNAYAQKYFTEYSMRPDYTFNRSETFLLLEVTMRDDAPSGDSEALNAAINQLRMSLQRRGTVVDRKKTDELLRTYRFGGGGNISTSDYKAIAQASGATHFVRCELSRDPSVFKKKSLSTVMAYIEILDARDGFNVVYSGRARTINPLSAQAEAEQAVRMALEGMRGK